MSKKQLFAAMFGVQILIILFKGFIGTLDDKDIEIAICATLNTGSTLILWHWHGRES